MPQTPFLELKNLTSTRPAAIFHRITRHIPQERQTVPKDSPWNAFPVNSVQMESFQFVRNDQIEQRYTFRRRVFSAVCTAGTQFLRQKLKDLPQLDMKQEVDGPWRSA